MEPSRLCQTNLLAVPADGDGGDGAQAQAHDAEEAEAPKMVLVPLDRPLLYIVTGHEDGCVRFWSETVRTSTSTSI